jgi:hypothetical protein
MTVTPIVRIRRFALMNFLDARGTGTNDVKKIYKAMQKARAKRAAYVDKYGPFEGTPDYGLNDASIDWNRNSEAMAAYVKSLEV